MTHNLRAPAAIDRRTRGNFAPPSVAAPPPVARAQPIDWPAKGCCWPKWSGDDEPRVFCAAVTPLGLPYCDDHMGVAYVKREDIYARG